MNRAEVIDVLGRLLQTLCRSLPMYLQEARPWSRHDDNPIATALDCLAADQKAFARRVADAIVVQGGRPIPGSFPMGFAVANDLSIDFLLQKVIRCQQQDVATIQQCVNALAEMPRLRSLADEIHGNAQGHLEILEQLPAGKQTSGTSS